MTRPVLAEREHMKLVDMETIIERGLSTFVEVGAALSIVREQKLYRATHDTFEAYCQDRWGWSRQRASQLIGASEVVQEMSTTVDNLPTTERHVRELSRVPEAERTEVWSKVIEAADKLPDGDPIITADLVRRTVDKHPALPEPERLRAPRAGTPSPSKKAPPKRDKPRSRAEQDRETRERNFRERQEAARAERELVIESDEEGRSEGREHRGGEETATTPDPSAGSWDAMPILVTVNGLRSDVDEIESEALETDAPAWVFDELRTLRQAVEGFVAALEKVRTGAAA